MPQSETDSQNADGRVYLLSFTALPTIGSCSRSYGVVTLFAKLTIVEIGAIIAPRSPELYNIHSRSGQTQVTYVFTDDDTDCWVYFRLIRKTRNGGTGT